MRGRWFAPHQFAGGGLYRRIKAKAAMEGRTVTEPVEAGLRTVMGTSAKDPITEPAWKRFAGVWSGPGWDKDKKLVDAEMVETS